MADLTNFQWSGISNVGGFKLNIFARSIKEARSKIIDYLGLKGAVLNVYRIDLKYLREQQKTSFCPTRAGMITDLEYLQSCTVAEIPPSFYKFSQETLNYNYPQCISVQGFYDWIPLNEFINSSSAIAS
jgi:hypothetical protein